MESSEIKRIQLIERQNRRNAESESILDSLGLDYQPSEHLILESADNVTLEDKPAKCKECSGKGKVKSLFSEYECFSCFGIGYDLSDPVRIMKWQQLCMSWSKTKIRKLERDLHIATTTEAERMEQGMNEFYKDIKKNHFRGD
ncbi:hypothetical protein I3271_05640 [Photobacterium leiognathi]|uniref:hypothetical protein n=1 Tax=Photobacterium leiognathi TaxID=553611 RepID=UPI001EDFB438|nr:hypothetical protein [Photobacterium leiognathi]MCG3884164.1 hypothetical protein [Photobacterium leiognathi]